MRNGKLAALCAALLLCLGGCAQSSQPENQAIAISLGADLTDTDEIRISVQIPNFAGSGSSEAGADQSAAGYALLSATAGDFTEALNLMRSTIPYSLNLAQLKTVVVSQELAESDRFQKLVGDMLLTNRFYSASYFLVSIGPAKDFIASQQSKMGVHLSSVVLAGIENYVQENRILDVRLVDMYYDLSSIYGSPVAILAARADGVHTTALEEGRSADALPGALPREGENQDEYSGTALFRDGKMVGTLSSLETAFCAYMRGVTTNIPYSCDGTNLELSPITRPGVKVDTSGDIPVIEVTARFSVTNSYNIDLLKELVTADISALFAKCQSLGTDPFLFSQRAAVAFADTPSWLAYDWNGKFPSARISLRLFISGLSE